MINKIIIINSDMSLPLNYKLIKLTSTDSTNLEARRIIKNGNMPSGSLAILAETQTGGKGRLDRKWVSKEGNLFLSVISNQCSDKIGRQEFLLPFRVAIAIGKTLSSFGNIQPLYKWPNDVLINGKKISGVLIELIDNFVIIGIGINVSSCPESGTRLPATCLYDYTDNLIQISDVMELLITNLDENLKKDTLDIINEWTLSAYGLDEKISVEQGDNKISGIFKGIDANGWLIIETEEGKRELVSFGDITWI
jgi:BirA family transcriptional regulator, biotin operon repressor / biotin---[acetyl-CoA-carboxylase] ligase